MVLQLSTSPYTLLTVTQINPEATIYLDQWALRNISTDSEWRAKFKQFLANHKATLELSWLHMLEYSEVTDQSQVRAVEDFLTDLAPDYIGFIEVIPHNVIERENRFLKNLPDATDPHLDEHLLKVFALHKRASLNPVSFNGFFSNQDEKMQGMCKTFMQTLNPTLEEVRRKAQLAEYKKNIAKVPAYDSQVQFLTRYLEIEICRSLLRNAKMKMNPNHWRDIFHLIVPMAYCQYVLADKTWYAIGKQAEARLREAGHKGPVAGLFCKIENFFEIVTKEKDGLEK